MDVHGFNVRSPFPNAHPYISTPPSPQLTHSQHARLPLRLPPHPERQPLPPNPHLPDPLLQTQTSSRRPRPRRHPSRLDSLLHRRARRTHQSPATSAIRSRKVRPHVHRPHRLLTKNLPRPRVQRCIPRSQCYIAVPHVFLFLVGIV